MLVRTHRLGELSRSELPSIQRDLNVKRLFLPLILSERYESRFCTHPLALARATHLRDDQELRKLREADDMVEQLRLPREKVRAADQLQGILQPKEALAALLVPVRLAQDLVGVDAQLRVARPRAVAHVLVDRRPVPPVLERVVRLDVAVLRKARAALVARPNQVV